MMPATIDPSETLRLKERHIAELLEVFRSRARFVVTSHARPDGDAVGSVLAMGAMLEQMGCTVEMVLADAVPAVYGKLPGVEQIRQTRLVEDAGDTGEEMTACIVLECDGVERTGLLGLEGRMLINIDHHASGRHFGAVNWIEPNECAVAAMVYEVAVASGVEVTAEMATCLYAAVLSDTGAFTYPGTDAATLELAYALARLGADPARLAEEIYFSKTEAQTRLLGVALTKMECGGGIAWTAITLAEMAQVGAVPEDAEGIVNHLVSMGEIECAMILRELPGAVGEETTNGGRFRLSLRSKGSVDVAAVAEVFGGGGHRNASGCTINGPLEEASGRVLAELRGRLGVKP